MTLPNVFFCVSKPVLCTHHVLNSWVWESLHGKSPIGFNTKQVKKKKVIIFDVICHIWIYTACTTCTIVMVLYCILCQIRRHPPTHPHPIKLSMYATEKAQPSCTDFFSPPPLKCQSQNHVTVHSRSSHKGQLTPYDKRNKKQHCSWIWLPAHGAIIVIHI